MIDHEREDLTPDAERARELLRTAEAPRASAAFKARLREQFTSGQIEGRGGTEEGGRVVALPRRWHVRPFLRVATAIAAGVFVVITLSEIHQGPRWTVLSASGTGSVQVDGDWIPIGRLDQLRDRIRPGTEVGVPEGGRLEVVSRGSLLLELTPGTRLTIPDPLPRWFFRRGEIYAREGILRVTTGPSFRGARLDIHTPDAVTEVTGTTFAVIMEPAGTCVCVFEGGVRTGRRGQEMIQVSSGQRGFVFRDGRPPMKDSIRDKEAMVLAGFRDAGIQILEERKPR